MNDLRLEITELLTLGGVYVHMTYIIDTLYLDFKKFFNTLKIVFSV